jgi:uncharacterized NAD(P)/FAD-binding protein YdhS
LRSVSIPMQSGSTRAAFWEIIAIPDIRNQCAALAARLAEATGEHRTQLEQV